MIHLARKSVACFENVFEGLIRTSTPPSDLLSWHAAPECSTPKERPGSVVPKQRQRSADRGRLLQTAGPSSTAPMRTQRPLRYTRPPAPALLPALEPCSLRRRSGRQAPNEFQFRAFVATLCRRSLRRCR